MFVFSPWMQDALHWNAFLQDAGSWMRLFPYLMPISVELIKATYQKNTDCSIVAADFWVVWVVWCVHFAIIESRFLWCPCARWSLIQFQLDFVEEFRKNFNAIK